MKRWIVVVACMLAGVLGVAEPAAARHGHRHSGWHGNYGIYLGAPLFWGPSYYYRPWYPDYYYYPPRTVIIEREPPVYIQRQPAPQAQAPAVWYYCPDPAGYYPYVANCTQAWVPVDPRSVPPPPAAPQ